MNVFAKLLCVSQARPSAHLLALFAQVADASFTPFIGMALDRTKMRCYGPRKMWHLVGVVCVACSFSFIFHDCIGCERASPWAVQLYYSCIVVVFQFGWACSQISHLSLIPILTYDKNEQVALNGFR